MNKIELKASQIFDDYKSAHRTLYGEEMEGDFKYEKGWVYKGKAKMRLSEVEENTAKLNEEIDRRKKREKSFRLEVWDSERLSDPSFVAIKNDNGKFIAGFYDCDKIYTSATDIPEDKELDKRLKYITSMSITEAALLSMASILKEATK